jgi:hypothetical protein
MVYGLWVGMGQCNRALANAYATAIAEPLSIRLLTNIIKLQSDRSIPAKLNTFIVKDYQLMGNNANVNSYITPMFTSIPTYLLRSAVSPVADVGHPSASVSSAAQISRCRLRG